jgi:hypothetical protein
VIIAPVPAVSRSLLWVFIMAKHTANATSSKPAKPQRVTVPSTATAIPSESKPNSLIETKLTPVTAEMRQAMIAEAAYYIAEQRGFGSGRDVDDWLLAEKRIDAALSDS